jgi:hypothetical protein
MSNLPPPDDGRNRAIARIKRRRAFYSQAATFAVVTVVLVVIWAIGGGGFFWPVFPMLGFAIALGAQARDLFSSGISDSAIDREMRRDRGRDAS